MVDLPFATLAEFLHGLRYFCAPLVLVVHLNKCTLVGHTIFHNAQFIVKKH